MRARVYDWMRTDKLPEGYVDGQWREVSPEEIVKLFQAGYDVMLHHVCEGTGRKRKAVSSNIYLDECGRSFHQR